MSRLVVWIEALYDLLTECIVAMVVRIYGSLSIQQIIGGNLRVVEEVLDGDIFAWGVLMQTQMLSQLNQFQHPDSSEFSFGSVLVAWFLERVPLLSP
jgi:hypothetical protein